MSKAKVILNPYAGRWLALQRKPEVEAALRSADIDYELVQTERPGHGIQLTAQAVREGFSPIISAGGDGSISEVVNGLIEAAGDEVPPPLGIMPLGTANDFVVNLNLPTDLFVAAQVIATGKPKNVDLCQVNGHYFDNNSAIGLEPFITLIQERMTRLRGITRYLVATLRGIMSNPQWKARLQWEEGEYEGMVTLVTVGNCRRTGGIFYVTPHADPYDGLLTFVYGFMATRLQILRLLPRTMKPGPGNYVEHPAIHEIHTRWLRIHTETPTPMHTDGEIQSRAIQDLEYRVFPMRLPVILP
jgi:YegS/Rv2252/BmrU family lipid kinase